MGLNQVEKLYKKMITIDAYARRPGRINTRIRSEIFQKIMDDVERLIRKMKQCKRDSAEYRDIDGQVRRLLMKEIQVIIDDYVLAKHNGTLETWKNMYGDINYYIHNFYAYRDACSGPGGGESRYAYGFFDYEEYADNLS